MMEIWTTKNLLKVQIFLWMAWHDRKIGKKELEWVQGLKFCGKEEIVDHLLFRCPIPIATWCWVRNSLGWSRTIPASIEKF
jgi:hypothetical protein